jgi:hypothetical protein
MPPALPDSVASLLSLLRDDLVHVRTEDQQRLRWHLHAQPEASTANDTTS